ncbi:hypothetical protein [Frigoriglobus tundricola]|uniref:Uncharacterized protein n=1 Tax=Frigoriglobus tundricola TaxID=2774151 RepID=A0A6M5Z7W4_9BACT|nr:hypothetical protein [Frigoriglobus tundricola]QJX01333.1 hypothetical protein FTUN_8977 [Frigoriglobus tundricola]
MVEELVLPERLRRLARAPEADEVEEEEEDSPDGYRAFSLVRGIRQHALMLEFRLRSGDSLAFGYPWLREVRFNRSNGLVLAFDPQIVTVRGRHLESLHAGVLMHRARWVWEADHASAELVPESAALVEGITVGPG